MFLIHITKNRPGGHPKLLDSASATKEVLAFANPLLKKHDRGTVLEVGWGAVSGHVEWW